MTRATVTRISAASGNRDADLFQARCPCGWKGAHYTNRLAESRRLAERDSQQHACTASDA